MRLAGGYLVLLTVLLGPLLALGQSPPVREEVPARVPELRRVANTEAGLPFFFEHFSRQEYRQHHQNWAVVQDPRGVIYVANYDGVLEYDGASWRLIQTSAKAVVRSLAVDAAGQVYVGAVGDLGSLKPDSTGTLHFVSLRSEVDPDHRDFKDVWGTHATSEGVFFQTEHWLFHWDGRAMTVLESEAGFHTAFWVRDQFFIREWGVGLSRLVGDSLRLVPGGKQFADRRIYMMAPYGEDRLLIATREAGLFLYDGKETIAFPTEATALLDQYRLYHGCALPDEHYALSFLDGGGVVIIDEQGRIVQRLEESIVLPDGWVNYVSADAQGGLWMALNNDGIARMDLSSALSFYDHKLGLEGRVNSIARHHGRLYVATTTGLFVLEKEAEDTGEKAARTVFVKVLKGTSRDLLSAGSVLFVATDEGLFALANEAPPALLPQVSGLVFKLLESSVFQRIYIGKEDGLALLEPTPTGWAERPLDGQINEPVISMAEQADGTLWLSTDQEVFRLRFAAQGSLPHVERFGKEQGLPERQIRLVAIKGEVAFPSAEGVFRVEDPDASSERVRFYRDPALDTGAEASRDPLLSFFVDEEPSFWLVYPDRVEIATPQAGGSYVRETPPVLRFPRSEVVPVYVEEDGIAWFGDGNRLIRYDPQFQKRYDTPFSTLVRKISSGSGQVIFGGNRAAGQAEEPVLAYAHNTLRFEVAALSFNGVEENQYQYFLEGSDEQWSDWTVLKSKYYSGLSEGAYRFRVRARNAQGVVSDEAVFAFHLLPPWYRTWWAFGMYLVMILAATALYGRYRVVVEENKQAQEQARELARERVVNERLQQANRRLQEANDSLTKVNKLKDEFLATTSHELRTPLTAILGFTSVLQDELPRRYLEFLDPIESNSQRLLETVNALLELAKLRAGVVEVRREVIDVGRLIEEVNRLLAPLAYQKSLLLELSAPPQPLLVNLDRRFVERILNNLIGNAIKFTEQGTVSVAAQQKQDRVFISVTDTGIGIEESFVPHLFDEFKQESSGLSRSYEGSGLGLSITARLVRLMEGTIHVESRKGQGSVFTVSFPLHRPPVEQSSSSKPYPAMAE